MNIQVPKSITNISSDVAVYVRVNFPNILDVEDCPVELQNKWEKICNHELWYQDINRFIGDVYSQKSREM